MMIPRIDENEVLKSLDKTSGPDEVIAV